MIDPDMPIDDLRAKSLAFADSITDLCAEAWDRGIRDGLSLAAQICTAVADEVNRVHDIDDPLLRLCRDKLIEVALSMPKVEVPRAESA